MRRSRSSLLSLLVVTAFVLPGCKKNTGPTPGTGAPAAKSEPATTEPAAKTDPPAKPEPKKATVGCKLEARIEADVTLTKGCTLTVNDAVNVVENATVTIEPGVKLSFGPDAYLWVTHGRLSAKGTTEAPIVFTSASKTPAAGDWTGIAFDAQTSADTVLDHVVVEYAGRKGSGQGAITIRGAGAKRVTITASTIRKNEQVGLHLTGEDASFAKFEGNTFEANPAAMHVRADALGSVGANNKFGAPIEIEGNVTKTQTWPALDAPVHVTESARIGGQKTAAILTLADKTTLKFTMSTYLEVGADDGGGIVAKNATFTSVNATPAAGDWIGLFFAEKATGTSLDGCTISYGGRDESSGKGAVTFTGKASGVKIVNTTFRNNKQAAIAGGEAGCGDLAKAESGNTSEGVPLCAKAE
jgi:hypothetical protein